MMYVIYGNDGAIKKSNFTDYIQRGNNNVNKIFVGIEGRDNDEWAANVYFTLPDDSIPDPETIVALPKTEEIDGNTYKGWEVSIPASVTIYAGVVKFSVSAVALDNSTLFTYACDLVINPSSAIPNETQISLSQYNALVQLVNQKTSKENVIYVIVTREGVDTSLFLEGQIFFVKNENKFYKLQSGQLVEYTIFDPDQTYVTVESTPYNIPEGEE